MDVRTIDLSTTFLGMDLPLPFAVCAMGGMPQVSPQGDVEMVRGARSCWLTWPWPARHPCAAPAAMRWTTSTTERRWERRSNLDEVRFG